MNRHQAVFEDALFIKSHHVMKLLQVWTCRRKCSHQILTSYGWMSCPTVMLPIIQKCTRKLVWYLTPKQLPLKRFRYSKYWKFQDGNRSWSCTDVNIDLDTLQNTFTASMSVDFNFTWFIILSNWTDYRVYQTMLQTLEETSEYWTFHLVLHDVANPSKSKF